MFIFIFSALRGEARGVIGNIMHHVVTLGALFSAAGLINCNQDDNNINTFIILSALQCCFVFVQKYKTYLLLALRD